MASIYLREAKYQGVSPQQIREKIWDEFYIQSFTEQIKLKLWGKYWLVLPLARLELIFDTMLVAFPFHLVMSLWYNNNDYDHDYHFYSSDGGGDGCVDDEDAQWRRNYYGSSDNDDNNVNYDDDDDNDGDDNDDDGDDDWYLHAGQDEAVSNKMCWVANSLASLEAGK